MLLLKIIFIFCCSIIYAQEFKQVVTPEKKLIERPINFVEKVNENYLQLKNLKLDSEHCVDFITDRIKKIDSLTSNSFFPKTEVEKEELKKKGVSTLEMLFEIREMIRARQRSLQEKDLLNYDCLQSVKTATRYVRFMEEMLMEWLVDQNVIQNTGSSILSGHSPQVLTAKKFKVEQDKGTLLERIKVGDLFLIRGKSYVSAMIARIGDAEMQFSHLAIVGLNDKNEKIIVEALIPFGSKISPLQEWLNQKEARVVHFRFNDAQIAEKSGRAAYKLAQEYIDKNKQTIPYDFNMNPQDQSQIFCAELIENSFLHGSDFKVHLPEHKTLATKFKSTVFLKNMGIESDLLFSPGDIEFDSRFDLIADYRFLGKDSDSDNFTLLRKVRLQDSIIQSIYNWMILDNYQFVENSMVNVKAYMAKLFRYLGFFEVKLPKHMPMNSLKTIVHFEEISHVLEKPLFKYEEKFYKENGHSLHFQEMLMFLAEYKKKECQNPSSDLNKLFRPIQCK
jgi:hypothetical protein